MGDPRTVLTLREKIQKTESECNTGYIISNTAMSTGSYLLRELIAQSLSQKEFASIRVSTDIKFLKTNMYGYIKNVY